MLYEFYRDGKKLYICPVPKAGCDFSAEWNCFWEVIDLDLQACSKAEVTNNVMLEVGGKKYLQSWLWVATKLGSTELKPSGIPTFFSLT